jgi:carotenoid cleavage dioxygenase-like enzyme
MPTDPRYLEGSFAPVSEEITAFDLPVTGRIPAGLSGRYLRNGPNPLGLDDPAMHHLFVGEGMVHGVRLRDGSAEWYRNRWVRSKDVTGKLGETWRGGPVHKGADFAANTHVIGHAGSTFATVEAGARPYELSYELDTIGPCDFGGTLPGGYAAHTKIDPRTSELHAIAYFSGWDYVQHIVIDPRGRVSRTANIPVADSPMMHDFALTEKYIVLYDLPVTFSMDAVNRGERLPYQWNEAHPPRVGLLPRDGSADVQWLDVDPCFVFHTLNAYDDGGQVVVDVVRYPRMFDLLRLRSAEATVLERWTLDLARGKVATRQIGGRGEEFPRVDERMVSRPYRYGYTACIPDLSGLVTPEQDGLENLSTKAFGNALIKYDLERDTSEIHDFGRDAYVGEGVFVPRTADAAEDDGYVMAFAHNPERDAADLVILPAQDFTGAPVARVHLPARIPLGFHGSWIPDD